MQQALAATNGNKTRAAKLLSCDRKTLQRRLPPTDN
jgi:DNA-binding protein Fis